jgi:hypothetical protein
LVVAALVVVGAAALAMAQLGSDEEDEVPTQPNAVTSDQVQARAERWKRDRPADDGSDCDVAAPKARAERHAAWVEVTFELESLARSSACRPYAVVGVLISGAPEEGKWTSISRARVTDRSGTVILSRDPLRGNPPKRVDVTAVAVSGSSSRVVSIPLD